MNAGRLNMLGASFQSSTQPTHPSNTTMSLWGFDEMGVFVEIPSCLSYRPSRWDMADRILYPHLTWCCSFRFFSHDVLPNLDIWLQSRQFRISDIGPSLGSRPRLPSVCDLCSLHSRTGVIEAVIFCVKCNQRSEPWDYLDKWLQSCQFRISYPIKSWFQTQIAICLFFTQ